MGKLAAVYYEVAYRVDSSQLKRADNELKKADGSVTMINKKTNTFTGSIGEMNSNLAMTATGFITIGAAISSAVVALERFNEESRVVDDTIMRINAKSDSSMEGYNSIVKGITNGSKELNISQLEVSKGYDKFAMAGWRVADSNNALIPALNLVKVSGEDTAVVLDIVTDQMTALGYESTETTKFVDMLGYASNKSNINVSMLGETLKYISPVSKVLKVETTELTATIMALGDESIKASQAGTGLRAGLSNLSNPTKKQKQLLKELNIELEDGKGGFIGLMEFLTTFKNKTKDLTDMQKAQALSILFGKESMTAWSIAVEQSDKKIKDYNNQLKNSQGYTEKYTNYLKTSTLESIKGVKTEWNSLKISLGRAVDPHIYKSATALKETIEEIGKIAKNMEPVVDFITGSFIYIGESIDFVENKLDKIGGKFEKVVDSWYELFPFMKKIDSSAQEFLFKKPLTQGPENTLPKTLVQKGSEWRLVREKEREKALNELRQIGNTKEQLPYKRDEYNQNKNYEINFGDIIIQGVSESSSKNEGWKEQIKKEVKKALKKSIQESDMLM